MNEEEHKQRHLELHKSLDELVANFISDTQKLPSNTSLMYFMTWSYEQTIKPQPVK